MKAKYQDLLYIIIYVIGIVLLFMTAIFYRQPLLSVFLILLLIMPPLSIYGFIKALPLLKTELRPEMTEYESGTEGRLVLSVSNPTLLPLLNCRLFFTVMNMYYPDDYDRELLFSAEAKCDKDIYIPLTFTGAGMIKINVSRLVISDPLHMYSKEIAFNEITELPVLPQKRELSDLKFSRSEASDEDSVWAPDGELTRDIRDIREYRPGDRLKDIHWLLAARTDELPVKEYERAKELYLLLLPELECDDLQDTLETFYSLAVKLMDSGEIYRVAVYHSHEDIVELKTVDSDEALMEVLYELFREHAPETSPAMERLKMIYPDAHGIIRIKGHSITEDS